MVRTVAQEMSNEERAVRLLHGLKATASEKVTVNFSHLAQAIGMDKAESLVEDMAETHELVQSAYSSKLRQVNGGICVIDRVAAIEAIEGGNVITNKSKIDQALRAQGLNVPVSFAEQMRTMELNAERSRQGTREEGNADFSHHQEKGAIAQEQPRKYGGESKPRSFPQGEESPKKS